MDFNQLDQQLRDSLNDLRLSNQERDELRQLGSNLSAEQVRYLRNRAFALVRELIAEPGNVEPALKWLEQVVKTLDSAAAPRQLEVASAHFSPGKAAGGRSASCAGRRGAAWISVSTPFPTTSSARKSSPAIVAASWSG